MENDKWNAVYKFSKIFDIGATDVAANLEDAFEQNKNILFHDTNLAYTTLERCARIFPDEVRLLFKNLLDEKDSFELRMILYRSQTIRIDNLMRGSGFYEANVEELNKISTAVAYLVLICPDKYYFYDTYALSKFCEKIKLAKPGVVLESKYEEFVEFYDKIRMALEAHPIILKLVNETNEKGFVNYHLLTCSFITGIAKYFVHLDIKPDINHM